MFKDFKSKERRKRIIGLFLRPFGWSLSIIGIVFMIFVMGGKVNNQILMTVPAVSLFFGFLFVRYSKKLLAESASAIRFNDRRQPVLLLRPFEIDDNQLFSDTGYSLNFEQVLVSALAYIGPVITVGRPKEVLAPLGAARLYIDSDEWKTEVRRLMDDARAVVLVLFTKKFIEGPYSVAGFRWEIEQAFSQIDPTKVLIVLPRVMFGFLHNLFRRRKEIQALRSSFRMFIENIQNILPYQIPDNCEKSLFLCFDSQWRPKALQSRRNFGAVSVCIDALLPFFQALGISPPTTHWLIIELRFNTFFILVFLIVFLGIISSYLF
jgi:hypothetical protein